MKCRKKLNAVTTKCTVHICDRHKGHSGKHKCGACDVVWFFKPHENSGMPNPFEDTLSDKDLGPDWPRTKGNC